MNLREIHEKFHRRIIESVFCVSLWSCHSKTSPIVKLALLFVFVAKNEACANIHKELVAAYGGSYISYQIVCKWQNSLHKGLKNVHDKWQFGRPSHALGDYAAIDAFSKICEEDRQQTIDKICDFLPPIFEIGRSSVAPP